MLQFKTQIEKGNQQPFIQAKLKIGQPGDKYEQEADAVADRVMMMSDADTMQMQPMEEEEEMMQPKIQMQEEEEEEALQTKIRMQPIEEEEEMMQPKSVSDNNPDVLTKIESQINSQIGRGQMLSKKSQRFFGSRLGANFRNVRIHTGSVANRLNSQLNSYAFTTGNSIFFKRGNYNPNSTTGKRLLAHELTHVVQQGASHLSHTQTSRKKIQKLGLGPSPTADPDWKAVPVNHTRRVNTALAIIRRVATNRRLKNYFRDHAPGGTLATLQNIVNRAIVWELRNEGNLGLSVEGGNDMAYDMLIYRIGRYQIAATLLHEMGHLARFPTEAECEGAPEAARAYAPFITGLNRNSGRVGETITITGISFGPSQGTTDKVKFNGVDAGNATFWRWRHNTQGQIRIRIPAGATTGNVVVENNTISSNGINFTILP